MGFRLEYEKGATERYNRMIGNFDPNYVPVFAKAAEAAYAANPIPELPASQFKVVGGNTYVGVGGAPRQLYKNELMWMPRIGIAYQLGSKTVLRTGYGSFFDTINVMNFGPNQYGFSRGTNMIVTNDFGQTWNYSGNANPSNGGSPLRDPFPVRADGRASIRLSGIRWVDSPDRGRGFDYVDFTSPHARQQRWMAGLQRAIGTRMVLSATYQGSYSDRVSLCDTGTVNTCLFDTPLGQQYHATGLARNDANANNMNANVRNPFLGWQLPPSRFQSGSLGGY